MELLLAERIHGGEDADTVLRETWEELQRGGQSLTGQPPTSTATTATPRIPTTIEEEEKAAADAAASSTPPPTPPSTAFALSAAEASKQGSKRESLAAGRSRRSSVSSRPIQLSDFPPGASQVLTPRARGGAEWCTVSAHVEGKLQIELPEGWDPELPRGGKEMLSLLDLQSWMRRAPFGHVMGLTDVMRGVKATKAAARSRRVPLGALSEAAATPTSQAGRNRVNTPAASDGSKLGALVDDENDEGVSTRGRATRGRSTRATAQRHPPVVEC